MIKKAFYILKTNGLRGTLIRIFERFPRFVFIILQKHGSNSVTSNYGVKMKKNWLDTTFRFCIFGAYGNFFSNHLRKKRSKFAFIDIGANQGVYTLIAAKNIYCTTVTSFEPVDETFKFLESNIKINKVEAKCNTIKKGIGFASKNISINKLKDHSGAASIAHSFDQKENVYKEKIEIIDQEVFLNLKVCKKNEPIVCKIDVEGKESEVIKILVKSNIINNINEIYYEIREEWSDPLEIKNLLENHGFNNFQKIGDHLTKYDILAFKN